MDARLDRALGGRRRDKVIGQRLLPAQRQLPDIARRGHVIGRPGTAPPSRAPASAPTSTEMIGVPTSAVVPSGTSSPATTPSYGDGSSTTALAVSISTMIWLIVTLSPGWTCHLTMSASVRPSPTSGSLNCLSSDMRPSQ